MLWPQGFNFLKFSTQMRHKFGRLEFTIPPKPMEEGLINRALKRLVIEERLHLRDVQQYLLMKFKIDVEQSVLQKRLDNMSIQEKAVA